MQADLASGFAADLASTLEMLAGRRYRNCSLYLGEESWIGGTYSAVVSMMSPMGEVLLTRYLEASVTRDWTSARVYSRPPSAKLLFKVGSFASCSVARSLAEGALFR